MATLEKIRSKAGLLVGVVGVALLAFIIGDFLRSGSTFVHQSKEKIVVVDGEGVSIRDFQAKVEELTEVYKKRSGNNSLNDDAQAQIREAVFSGLVNKILLEKESKQIGLSISKEELSDLIIGDNPSPVIQQMPDFVNRQTGTFDKNLLIQFLQTIEADDLSAYPPDTRAQIESAKKYWLFWEQTIKEQKLENKYSVLLGSAIAVNSLDAKSAFEDEKVSVDFDFVLQNYQSVPDDQVAVSESEIQSLYNKRKEIFKQEAGKVIDYIAVDILPSAEDQAAVERVISGLKAEFSQPDVDVSSVVNENSDVKYEDIFRSAGEISPAMKEFVEKANVNDVDGPLLDGNSYVMYKLVAKTQAPDSIKMNQLLLPNINDEVKLKAIADSLIGVLHSGVSFAEMSKDATNGQSLGEVGWITESQLVTSTDPKFTKELFNAPLNTPFVAKSTYGSHLVLVTEKTKPVTKYKIANIQIAVTPSTETYNKLYNDLNAYVSKNRTLDAFKSAAAEAGYALQSDITLTQNQQTIGDIRSSRPVVRWAFEHKKGEVSDIFECQDRFVVAAVEGSLKEGFRSLSSVSEILKRELINDKKAEKIIKDLKSKNLTSFDQYISAMNAVPGAVKFVTFATQNISGIGMEPIINARAPQMEIGKISDPMKGKIGVYVLKVTNKINSDAQFNPEVQKRSMESMNMYRMYSFMTALKEQSDIQDNRIRFY